MTNERPSSPGWQANGAWPRLWKESDVERERDKLGRSHHELEENNTTSGARSQVAGNQSVVVSATGRLDLTRPGKTPQVHAGPATGCLALNFNAPGGHSDRLGGCRRRRRRCPWL